MRVKIQKDIRLSGAPTVLILSGSILDVTPETGSNWIKSGAASPVIKEAETAIFNPPAEKAVVLDKDEIKRQQTAERVRRHREKKALQKQV